MSSKKNLSLFFIVYFSVIMVESKELINLWIALEGQSLAMLTMLSISLEKKGKFYSPMVLFLMGTIIGTLSLILITGVKTTQMWMVTVSVMMLQLLWLSKLGLFPGHLFSLAVMEGMSWPMFFLFSTIPKFTLLFVMYSNFNSFLLGSVVSNLSMVLVAVLSLNQSKLTSILTFSGMFSMVLMYYSQYSSQWYVVVLVYSLHMMTILGVTKLSSLSTIYSLSNFSALFPMFGVMFSMLILSIMGIPPLAGFVGKIIPIFSLIDHKNTYSLFHLYMSMLIMCFAYLSLFSVTLTKPYKIQPLYSMKKSNNQMTLMSFLLFLSCIFVLTFILSTYPYVVTLCGC